jgi:hypothetical protein
MLVFLEPNGLTKKGKAKWEKTFPYLPEYGKHGMKMGYTDVPPAYNYFSMVREDFKDFWRHEEFIKNVASWNFASQMFTGIPVNQIETFLKDDEYEKSGMELFLANLFERLQYIESKIETIDDDLYDVKNKFPQEQW